MGWGRKGCDMMGWDETGCVAHACNMMGWDGMGRDGMMQDSTRCGGKGWNGVHRMRWGGTARDVTGRGRVGVLGGGG